MKTTIIWKGNTFTYDDVTKVITLNAGSIVNPTPNATYIKSRPVAEQQMRKDYVDEHGRTTIDIPFKSLSACASFIVGGSKSGTEYFKHCDGLKGVSSTTTPTSDTPTSESTSDQKDESPIDEPEQRKKEINTLIKQFIYFCKDFAYNPDIRLLNSLYHQKDSREFFLNTLKLIGHDEDMIEVAKSKTESAEFKNFIKVIKSLSPTRDKMNKRLEIKFGKAGTGKTTSAIKENPDALRMIASATDDPSDLFTTFNPTTKEWEKTPLSISMEEGKPVIIDEANFYHQECLKRLQGITDETKVLNDRGIEIKINDGFKIVITMNLETNFGKKPLPSPLVDRASKIECYDELQDLSWVW